jgi:hypothetical protein
MDKLGQGYPVHGPRHVHVGEQDVDVGSPAEKLHCRRSVLRFQDLVAFGQQPLAGEPADHGFIFDEQDDFSGLIGHGPEERRRRSGSAIA